MSEDKAHDDLYQKVEEHLQELFEPGLPEAKLSPAERFELLQQARASGPCRELIESYEKTVALVGALPDNPVPGDFEARVRERLDEASPAIPFYRNEFFQRLVGAAAAVVLIAMVFWGVIFPPDDEGSLELAMNDPTGETTLAANEDKLLPSSVPARSGLEDERARFSLDANPSEGASRDGSRAPGSILPADAAKSALAPKAQPEPVLTRPEIADVVVAAKPLAEPAVEADAEETNELADIPGSPKGARPAPAEIASAEQGEADVGAPAADAGPASAESVKVAGKKPAGAIEVSRESVDGQLVAVRYEVAVSSLRLAELNSWRKKRANAPGAGASRAALRKTSRPSVKRESSPRIVSADQGVGGKAPGEVLKLLVDIDHLDQLAAELSGLQGPAKESSSAGGPADGEARKIAAVKADRSSAPAQPRAAKTSRSRKRSRGLGQPGNWPGPGKKGSSAEARAVAKSPEDAKAKVRVEIRFRIISD